MKLKFKIYRLPQQEGQQYNTKADNIPLIHTGGFDETELWFLWDKARMKRDIETRKANIYYIYKKL